MCSDGCIYLDRSKREVGRVRLLQVIDGTRPDRSVALTLGSISGPPVLFNTTEFGFAWSCRLVRVFAVERTMLNRNSCSIRGFLGRHKDAILAVVEVF